MSLPPRVTRGARLQHQEHSTTISTASAAPPGAACGHRASRTKGPCLTPAPCLGHANDPPHYCRLKTRGVGGVLRDASVTTKEAQRGVGSLGSETARKQGESGARGGWPHCPGYQQPWPLSAPTLTIPRSHHFGERTHFGTASHLLSQQLRPGQRRTCSAPWGWRGGSGGDPGPSLPREFQQWSDLKPPPSRAPTLDLKSQQSQGSARPGSPCACPHSVWYTAGAQQALTERANSSQGDL